MSLRSTKLISYGDNRGELYPCWRKKDFELDFVEDRFSRSTRGVVRGMHGDAKTWKLCTCVYGQLALIVWDVRESKKYNFTLDDDKKLQVLIPPFCLNAMSSQVFPLRGMASSAILHWYSVASNTQYKVSVIYCDIHSQIWG